MIDVSSSFRATDVRLINSPDWDASNVTLKLLLAG